MSDKQKEHTANIIAIQKEELKDNRAKLLRARRRVPLFGRPGFVAFAASNDRVKRGEAAAAIVRDNLILPVMVNEAELREIRIAEAASAILQVEIETGEVLNEAQTTELLASYASVDYRALANLEDRTWIVTQGQDAALVPEIDLEGIPPPAWLVSLQNDVSSVIDAIRNRIIPFELIDRIRYYLDPTPEQLDERVAGRQAREAQQRRMIHNMDDLLDRIKTVTADHPGYHEAKEFAKYFSCRGEGNMYITSLEAPCRMDTRHHIKRKSKKEEKKSESQDPIEWSGSRMGKTAKRSPRKTGFTGLRPAALQTQLQEILRLAGNADDILRHGFGITARFAVWSPYGAGPDGLSRLFLIYDGVIEPRLKARILDPANNAELVTALGVLTAQVEGQAIVADAKAEAFISRPAAQAEIIQQIETQWVAAYPGQEQFEPVPLLNAPVVDAYIAWSAALWTQSHLTHEQKVSPDILAAHCRMIEFRLGREGRHYRRSINCPTFYELNIQGPLYKAFQTFTNFCSRRIASVEGGAERVCNYLGVNDAAVIELAQEMTPQQRADRLVAIVARARAQARRRRIRDLINGVGAHAQDIFNSAAVTTTIAVAQGASASARAAQGGARAAAAAGTQAVNYSIRTAPIIAAAIAEQSIKVGAIIPSIETQVVGAGGGLRQGIEVIVGPAAVNIEAVGAQNIVQIMDNQVVAVEAVINAANAAAAQPLQVPSSGLNNIENIVGNSALATVVALVPTVAEVEEFVGGGIRLKLNAPLGEATMIVSPVVLIPTGIIQEERIDDEEEQLPINQITTSINVSSIIEDNEEVRQVLNRAIDQVIRPVEVIAEEAAAAEAILPIQGLGIYNKRKTAHRTKKYIRGKKGCKGTKKGCKKGRGKGSKRGTSNKGMPTDTMRILKQKLKL
jgi:hypothetical protein